MRLVRALIAGLCVFCLLGCAAEPAGDTPAPGPLLYESKAVSNADRLVIFVPGALTSVVLFDPANGWAAGDFAPAYYRFPGLDGVPVTPLDLDAAAAQIARFANSYPDKDVALVGYSSGAPIALMAAAQITGDRVVPVAAISPAVERGGGMTTLAMGASDILRSAVRAGTLDPVDVWIEYWQILLQGRSAPPIPEFRERVIETARIHRGERGLGPPDPQLARSHSRQVSMWELPHDLDLSRLRVRIYVGLEDPVFSTRQTLGFARKLGVEQIYGYPGDGHLLYLTQPDVFETARRFAEDVFEAAR